VIEPELRVRDHPRRRSKGVRRVADIIDELGGTEVGRIINARSSARRGPSVGGARETMVPGGFIGARFRAETRMVGIRRHLISLAPRPQNAMQLHGASFITVF